MIRHPRRTLAGFAVAAAAAVTAPAAFAQDATAPTAPADRTLVGRVLGSPDGTTLTVRAGGRRTTVRLLGVGDPGRDAGTRGPCLRAGAGEFVAGLLPASGRVRLVTSGDRDSSGRLLAWAYRGDNAGQASLNRAVVAAGWAPVASAGGTLRHAAALARAERTARKKRLGRWGTTCGLSTVQGVQRRLVDLGYLPSGAVSGDLDYRTQQAVMAFQGWSGLPRTGTLDAATRARLAKGSRPVPRNRGIRGRALEVHIDRQVLLLIEDGRVTRAIHVSTGAGGRTPRGRFSVIRRERWSWSVPFSVTLPYAQYFFRGFALHESPSVPGYPASAGCVRLPSPEAPVVWEFSTYGTPVTVA